MFSTLKKYLYNNVYVNILQSSNNLKVYVEEISHDGSSHNYEKVFKGTERSKMFEYALENMKKSPISYVSILDPSLNQGAVPTCSQDEIGKYCEIDEYESICKERGTSFLS